MLDSHPTPNEHEHTLLPVARLGRTGLPVSRLALGTVELGVDYGIPAPGHFGKPTRANAIRLVHTALEAGINFIDTARAYGSSEEVLGEALQDCRQRVILASKFSTQMPPDTTAQEMAAHMRSSLDASLAMLQTDWLDIWQVHNVDQMTLERIETIAEVFDRARTAGKIRFGGGSFYGADLPLQALAHNIFDVMQVTYSALDQRVADQFLVQAKQQDVGIIVRSILLKGALTERGDFLPEPLAALTAASRRFRTFVAEHLPEFTPAQVAIAFGLAHPDLHTILVGVRTTEEIQENVRAAQLVLPPTFIEAIRQLRIDDPLLLNPATWGIP